MEIISKSAYSHVCHVADLLFKTADVGKKEGGCSPHPSEYSVCHGVSLTVTVVRVRVRVRVPHRVSQ